MKNKRFILMIAAAAVFLLVPFIAMQFTQQIDWSLSDFILMGTLLLGTVFLFELILRKLKTLRSRIIAFGIGLLVFFLIWVELAVGIFGTPFAGS